MRNNNNAKRTSIVALALVIGLAVGACSPTNDNSTTTVPGGVTTTTAPAVDMTTTTVGG
ncbi:MAG: hypothetical protein WA726_04820 [Acidimicrobiia bacterium]